MKKPEVFKVHGPDGEIKEVTLVDVQAVLEQHTVHYPLELPSGRGTLVFRRLPYHVHADIVQRHEALLTPEYYNTLSQVAAMRGRETTPEEEKMMKEFEALSWPYTFDLLHNMLVKPEMQGPVFEEFLSNINEEDRRAIFKHCKELEERADISQKNSSPPPAGPQ